MFSQTNLIFTEDILLPKNHSEETFSEEILEYKKLFKSRPCKTMFTNWMSAIPFPRPLLNIHENMFWQNFFTVQQRLEVNKYWLSS